MALLVLASLPARADAQREAINTTRLEIQGLGAVVTQTALKMGPGLPKLGGMTWVTGTVVTSHVGPYQLQARLANGFPDTVKVKAASANDLVPLSTTGWTTIATGPGGPTQVNRISILILSARSTRAPEKDEEIPLIYQVVP